MTIDNGMKNVEDPDFDLVPHIIMQVKRSIDMGGNNKIVFKNGDNAVIPFNTLLSFMRHYNDLKPYMREEIQNNAIMSFDNFNMQLEKMMSY